MPAQIAVIGEALVDVVADGTAFVGGSPLNVAVGLARLGLPVTLHTRVGDDGYGRQITSLLDSEGVTLPDGAVDDGRTSVAAVTLDDAGVAQYDFTLGWSLPSPDLTGVSLVHTGSIGAVLEPGGAVTRRAVAAAGSGVLRSYDPNIRPDVMGDPAATRAKVRDLAAACHVVKFSDEDARWLAGDGTDGTVEDVLTSVAASGPRVTVVTRGGQGCTAVVDGRTYDLAARPAEVVDTIGAGDAFMSGLLFALVRDGVDRSLVTGAPVGDGQVRRALETALASAAVAVSREGAQPPSPSDLPADLRTDLPADG
ncbi:carbohydrate kinase family protein [Corynebacterium kalidii]|uniref:Carbohydrate kinase n=1 Tax=Corynebacterium kalidii TaxID=2931982 RepID=A0A9X2B283_9CORY|nr:carbohydrate kinase [Corynebacterium kalidii]MCJ7858869.1 carbohydrate kinase [Corynebacterium kalidii]